MPFFIISPRSPVICYYLLSTASKRLNISKINSTVQACCYCKLKENICCILHHIVICHNYNWGESVNTFKFLYNYIYALKGLFSKKIINNINKHIARWLSEGYILIFISLRTSPTFFDAYRERSLLFLTCCRSNTLCSNTSYLSGLWPLTNSRQGYLECPSSNFLSENHQFSTFTQHKPD